MTSGEQNFPVSYQVSLPYKPNIPTQVLYFPSNTYSYIVFNPAIFTKCSDTSTWKVSYFYNILIGDEIVSSIGVSSKTNQYVYLPNPNPGESLSIVATYNGPPIIPNVTTTITLQPFYYQSAYDTSETTSGQVALFSVQFPTNAYQEFVSPIGGLPSSELYIFRNFPSPVTLYVRIIVFKLTTQDWPTLYYGTIPIVTITTSSTSEPIRAKFTVDYSIDKHFTLQSSDPRMTSWIDFTFSTYLI